jgi:tRNA dimethylallyltransferase
MIDAGLEKEVKDLLAQGFRTNLKPLLSIGYKETIQFLNQEIKTKEELIERIAISTRQLAKSQRTFFKKITPKITLNPLTDHEKIQQLSLNFLMEK